MGSDGRGAYRATAAGERMAAAAERIEQETLALDRDIAGRDRRPAGKLRVTSSETLAQSRLIPHLAAFRQAHPNIVVELVIDNRVLDLLRREADIALRPMRPTEGNLWGRKLSDVAWTFYAAKALIEQSGGPITRRRGGAPAADRLGRKHERHQGRRLARAQGAGNGRRLPHQQPGQSVPRCAGRHRRGAAALLSR